MTKKLQAAAIALFAAAGVYGFIMPPASGITGKILPAEGGAAVWAIQGTDSISARPVEGLFNLELKPGWYKIVVQTNLPYKPMQYEKMEVQEGKTTDLGEIRLEK